MKVALCFIVNYQHVLHKEKIWREWIEYNQDIINVYFYYSDITKIRSPWIMKHTIPPSHIFPTSYLHVIPAYLSVLHFAFTHSAENQWFCLLTDSCCPIVSPKRFRYLFFNHYNKSIMNWRKAWWNVEFHKRANLQKLSEEFRLANDPWFLLKRENVYHCIQFMEKNKSLVQTVSRGGLANESLFAIMLHGYNQLDKVLPKVTHLTDWIRQSSSTSPHIFREANEKDIEFIERSLAEHEYAMFIRKIHPEFPDEVLKKYIYDFAKEKDDQLVCVNPVQCVKFYMRKYAMYVLIGMLAVFLWGSTMHVNKIV
jgi:hypothetical protein